MHNAFKLSFIPMHNALKLSVLKMRHLGAFTRSFKLIEQSLTKTRTPLFNTADEL